jgi:hypothetical protein
MILYHVLEKLKRIQSRAIILQATTYAAALLVYTALEVHPFLQRRSSQLQF